MISIGHSYFGINGLDISVISCEVFVSVVGFVAAVVDLIRHLIGRIRNRCH